MKTLLIIFIIWTVIKALADRARDRIPEPLPQTQEEMAAAYRLPPELREKWGPPADNQQPPEQAAPVPPAAPPAELMRPKQAGAKPLRVPEAAAGEGKPTAARGCRETTGLLLNGPALQQGIILAEILGPPAARRRRSKFTIN
ncbi:hypothetical protein JCM39194_13060 [Desulfotomaculum varum]